MPTIKQIEIVEGTSIDKVKQTVNDFLFALANTLPYYASEVKISLEIAMVALTTNYVYTIEYTKRM